MHPTERGEKGPLGVALAGWLPLSGCIANPTNHKTISDPYEQVTIAGLGTAPSVPIVIEVLNQASKQWETIAAAKTGEASLLNDKVLPLYEWVASVSISTREDASSLCRWSPTC